MKQLETTRTRRLPVLSLSATTMAPSDVSWKPAPGKHQVQLGSSLKRSLKARMGTTTTSTKRSGIPDRDFYSFCYNFKPESIDPSKTGSIEVKRNKDVSSVTVEHWTTRPGESLTFQGSDNSTKETECVLIYDEETGTFTLEKLDSYVTLQYVKLNPQGHGRASASANHERAPSIQGPSKSSSSPSASNAKYEEEEEGEVVEGEGETTSPAVPSPLPPPPAPPVAATVTTTKSSTKMARTMEASSKETQSSNIGTSSNKDKRSAESRSVRHDRSTTDGPKIINNTSIQRNKSPPRKEGLALPGSSSSRLELPTAGKSSSVLELPTSSSVVALELPTSSSTSLALPGSGPSGLSTSSLQNLALAEASDSEEEWEPVQGRVITMEEDDEPEVPVPPKTFEIDMDAQEGEEELTFDEEIFKKAMQDLSESDGEEEPEGDAQGRDDEDPTADSSDDDDFSSSDTEED